MKIGRIETFYVPPRWLFVRVESDDGAVGWGEASLEGHAEAVGELRDRGVRLHQLFEYAAPCRVGQGGERRFEIRLILNHVVQY